MTSSRRKRLVTGLVFGAVLLGATTAVLAQATAVRPPKAEEPQEVYTIVMYLVGLAGAAMVVGVSVLPSRRTHQD